MELKEVKKRLEDQSADLDHLKLVRKLLKKRDKLLDERTKELQESVEKAEAASQAKSSFLAMEYSEA